MIETVLGPVRPADLGVTHSHEHLVAHATAEIAAREEDLLLNEPARILPDLEAFRQAGGGAIVEMTTPDYGRDAAALRELSRRSCVHIIAASGYNKAIYCRPFVEGRTIAEIAAWMVTEVTNGIAGTSMKAGVIKFATSLDQIDPAEEKVLRAAARAHRQTGVPLISHTEAGTMAVAQVEILAEEGVEADRLIICHMDRNADPAVHLDLARRGAYLSYDQIPKVKYNTEERSIRLITRLACAGLHSRVLVGGDFARRSLFAGWGGGPGLIYLTTTYAARLRAALDAAGLDGAAVVQEILVQNPARALSRRAV
ncbi:MAG TPA: hypothetical protein VD969_08990 [Symbiobacteriaceae bacterium]|nr:hypothetical protein [Symbiobacteriaceae bacterium]